MTGQSEAGGLLGIGMFSSLLSGIGKAEAGQQEKQAYDYNAAITLENMRAKAQATQQQTSVLVGRQASAYARAGVDVASGSPLLVMAATAARGGQQVESIVQAGTEEATLQQYYGKMAAWQGTMGGIGDFLSGMSGDLSAYQKAMAPTPTPTAGP